MGRHVAAGTGTQSANKYTSNRGILGLERKILNFWKSVAGSMLGFDSPSWKRFFQ